MCSPNEIQKLYLSNAVGSVNLTEMACELFDPKVVTPQQPKPNIFKSIFSVTPFDREELCNAKKLIIKICIFEKFYF
jgi:PIN domain nuclease of toxin-antitoxin system